MSTDREVHAGLVITVSGHCEHGLKWTQSTYAPLDMITDEIDADAMARWQSILEKIRDDMPARDCREHEAEILEEEE